MSTEWAVWSKEQKAREEWNVHEMVNVGKDGYNGTYA